MNTTRSTKTQTLTADLFATFANRDDFLGFGYIGERRNWIEEGHDVAAADALALDVATEKGWTVERLFTWANSKNGRWFADVTLGSTQFDGMARRLVA